MNVVQGPEHCLEWKTLSGVLVLEIIRRAAALEYGNEKPTEPEERVDGNASDDDLSLPPLVDHTKEENGEAEFEDNSGEDIQAEDADN